MWLKEILPAGAWSRCPCFILGGGPSLRGFDYDQLRGELTIGINRTFEAFDPSLLVTMDERFVGWARGGTLGRAAKRIDSINATKVFYASDGMPRAGFYAVHANGKRFKLDWDGLAAAGSNSGFAALQVACILGASPIYLLGIDMNGDPNTGRQKWWHDGYPIVQHNDVYERMRQDFERWASTIAASGIEVVNLNPASALRCFSFGHMRDIPAPTKRPIVVCFHTSNAYKAEADKMRASAHRFGFDVDVRAVPPRGSWLANTRYKARFLRTMLELHPGRPVLWLDADAEVKQYPHAFDDLSADIACTVVDWRKYGRAKAGEELLSGTLYLANNRRVRALLDAWEAENERHPDVWEQRNLQRIIKGFPQLIVQRLPDNYCQIFDLMRGAGEPVIQQNQASRRLRGAAEREEPKCKLTWL